MEGVRVEVLLLSAFLASVAPATHCRWSVPQTWGLCCTPEGYIAPDMESIIQGQATAACRRHSSICTSQLTGPGL